MLVQAVYSQTSDLKRVNNIFWSFLVCFLFEESFVSSTLHVELLNLSVVIANNSEVSALTNFNSSDSELLQNIFNIYFGY